MHSIIVLMVRVGSFWWSGSVNMLTFDFPFLPLTLTTAGIAFISQRAQNYWMLLFARIMSGAGEASFISIVPPLIMETENEATIGMLVKYKNFIKHRGSCDWRNTLC